MDALETGIDLNATIFVCTLLQGRKTAGWVQRLWDSTGITRQKSYVA
jgi:hypothetical protein